MSNATSSQTSPRLAFLSAGGEVRISSTEEKFQILEDSIQCIVDYHKIVFGHIPHQDARISAFVPGALHHALDVHNVLLDTHVANRLLFIDSSKRKEHPFDWTESFYQSPDLDQKITKFTSTSPNFGSRLSSFFQRMEKLDSDRFPKNLTTLEKIDLLAYSAITIAELLQGTTKGPYVYSSNGKKVDILPSVIENTLRHGNATTCGVIKVEKCVEKCIGIITGLPNEKSSRTPQPLRLT